MNAPALAPAVETFLDTALGAVQDLERRLAGLVASGDVAWGRLHQLEEEVARLQAERDVLAQRARLEATRGDTLHQVLASALAWCQADARAHPEVQGYAKREELLQDAALGWARK